MAINLADLPLKYQRQVLAKMQTKVPAEQKRQKYGNQKTDRGALTFDSKKEAARYDELRMLLEAGEIKDLRLQAEFTLQEAYTTPSGERIRAIRYRADFTYYRRNGEEWKRIVEDVKSKATKTSKYAMKRKMMADKYGITIEEV